MQYGIRFTAAMAVFLCLWGAGESYASENQSKAAPGDVGGIANHQVQSPPGQAASRQVQRSTLLSGETRTRPSSRTVARKLFEVDSEDLRPVRLTGALQQSGRCADPACSDEPLLDRAGAAPDSRLARVSQVTPVLDDGDHVVLNVQWHRAMPAFGESAEGRIEAYTVLLLDQTRGLYESWKVDQRVPSLYTPPTPSARWRRDGTGDRVAFTLDSPREVQERPSDLVRAVNLRVPKNSEVSFAVIATVDGSAERGSNASQTEGDDHFGLASYPAKTPAPQVLGDVDFADDALRSCVFSHPEYTTSTPIMEVKLLDCTGSGIHTLSGIEHLTYLQMLSLANTQVNSVGLLRGLVALQSLNLSGTQVSNLEPLSTLTELFAFYGDNAPIGSVAPLLQSPALETLSAADSKVTSIPDLSDTQIEFLNLANNRLADISGLRGALYLEHINLSDSRIAEKIQYGSLASLIELTSSPESSLKHVVLSPHEALPCFHLDQLEQNLFELDNQAILYRPESCLSTTIPTNLGTTPWPSEGSDFSAVWEIEHAIDGSYFEIQEYGLETGSEFVHSSTDPHFTFGLRDDPNVLNRLGLVRFNVRHCHTGGSECSAWSEPATHVVLGDGTEIAEHALNSIVDESLRACLQGQIDQLKPSKPGIEVYSGQLTSLYCSNSGVEQLAGIGSFPNLRTLHLSGNAIHSLAPLIPLLHSQVGNGYMRGEINLSGNGLVSSGIEPLENFSGILKALDLSNNSIESLAGLAGLSMVGHLNVASNNLSSLDDLSGISFDSLSAEANQITIFPVLSNVRTLRLSANQIQSVPNGAQLPSDIRNLSVGSNPLGQISTSPFANLMASGPGLEYLNLDHSQISDLSFLGNLQALKTLSAHSNLIEQVPAVSSAMDLTEMVLSENPLSVLPIGTFYPALEYLDLSETSLTYFPDLSASSEIKSIRISGGNFSSSSNLDSITEALKLSKLWLSGNGLRDASGLLMLASNPQSYIANPSIGSAPVNIGGEPYLPCAQVETLISLELFSSDAGQSLSCLGEVEAARIFLDEDFSSYSLDWNEPVAPEQFDAVAFYEVSARNGGEQLLQSVPSDQTSAQFSLNLPQSGVWAFQVRACLAADVCGDWSSEKSASYPLMRVYDLAVSNGGHSLEWAYDAPVNSDGTGSLYFEVSPLFQLSDPILVSWGSGSGWALPTENFDEWPGGIVRVRLCEDTIDQGERCGESHEIRVFDKPADPDLDAPTWVNLQQDENNPIEYLLSWQESSHPNVTFYRIHEYHVIGGQVVSSSARRFFSESTQVAVKRFAPGNHLRYSVASCVVDELRETHCSDATYSSSDVDANQFGNEQHDPVSDLCWYSPSEIDIDNIGGHDWASASVKILWRYNSNKTVIPTEFRLLRTAFSAGPTLPHIDFRTPFNSMLYLDGGGVGWIPLNSSGESERIGVVRALGSSTSVPPIRVTALLRGVGGLFKSSETKQITPLILDSNGQPKWDENTRCEVEPMAEPDRNHEPVGGPGELLPGHWAMTLGNNQGFRFFWTSRLVEDPAAPGTFGLSYDLIALWHTYYLIDNKFSPVWYYSRMHKTDGSGSFIEGDLKRPVQGGGEDKGVGTIRVYFEDLDNPDTIDERRRAWVSMDVRDVGGVNEGAVEFAIYDFLLDETIWDPDAFSTPNQSDHFRGIWAEGDGGGLFDDAERILTDRDFFVSEWIVGAMNSVGVYTFDDEGIPLWLITFDCEGGFQMGGCQEEEMPDFGQSWRTLDLRSVINNAAAFWAPPMNSDGVEVVSFSGSGYRRSFVEEVGSHEQNFRAGKFCINVYGDVGGRDFSIQHGGQHCALSNSETANLQKIANLHGIEFQIVGQENSDQPPECDLRGDQVERCELRFSWFTDDYFPNAQPMFSRTGDTELRHLNELCVEDSGTHFDFAVADFECNIQSEEIDGSAVFRFHLVNRPGSNGHFDPDTSAIIATSRELTVLDSGQSNPGDPDDVEVIDNPYHGGFTSSLQAHSQRVGATRGEFRVTESGAAEYSIGIATAPGSGGMVPSVALQYNSQVDNGPFGVGFSLAGLSQIGRCGQTWIQDGVNTGVTLTEEDRFCLDGQRLISIENPDHSIPAICSNEIEYRLEIDDMTRIVGCGSFGGAPTHFHVFRRDGTKTTYGWDPSGPTGIDRSAEIRAGLQQTIYAWPVSRIKDNATNYISFIYEQPGQSSPGADPDWIEWLPKRIEYTGNLNASQPAYSEIVFESSDFEDRPTQFDGYTAGNPTHLTRRIHRIRSYGVPESSGGQAGMLRAYELAYEVDRYGFNILTAFKECWSLSELECFSPIHFEWAGGFSSAVSHPNHTPIAGSIQDFRGAQSADLSGDGRQEVVALRKGSSNRGLFRVYRAYLRDPLPGTQNRTVSLAVAQEGNDPNGFSPIEIVPACNVRYDRIGGWALVDLDGSGKGGLVYAVRDCDSDSGVPGLYYHPWNSTTGALDQQPQFVGEIPEGELGSDKIVFRVTPSDVDGDGLVDLILTLFSVDSGAVSPSPAKAWVYRNLSPQNPGASGSPMLSGPIEIENIFSGFEWPDPGHPDLCITLSSFSVFETPLFSFDHSGRLGFLANASQSRYCEPPGTFGLAALRALGDVFTMAELEEIISEFPSLTRSEDGFQQIVGVFSIEITSDGRVTADLWSDIEWSAGNHLIPVDYNSDGYTDLLVLSKHGSETRFELYMNDGLGIASSPEIVFDAPFDFAWATAVQVLDVYGNQMPDLHFLSARDGTGGRGDYITYRWPWVDESTGSLVSARVYAYSTIRPDYGEQTMYVDLLGNSRIDVITIDEWMSYPGHPAITVSEGRVHGDSEDHDANRFRQSRLLERVTDGFGAETRFVYKPMAHESVHSKDWLSVNAQSDYAVYDLATPRYLVAEVISSSPSYSHGAGSSVTFDANATASIRYHYAGARMQAGGRGFLGFSVISSYDAQSGMLTRTRYRQDYPFVGQASETRTWLLDSDPWSGGNEAPGFPVWVDSSCASSGAWSENLLGCSKSVWDVHTSHAGLQSPYLKESWEWSAVPRYSSGGVLNGSDFTHLTLTSIHSIDQFGNPAEIEVSVYANRAGTGTPFSSIFTVNEYADAEALSEGFWFLGRLIQSDVLHQREGRSDQIRSSCFRYGFQVLPPPSSAALGVLVREVVEPVDSGCTTGARRSDYVLDDFGNRLEVTLTASGETRRTGTRYDSRGAMVVAEEFYLDSQWHKSSEVLSWDRYGNPLQTSDARGVVTGNRYDDTGRFLYSYAQDGSWARTWYTDSSAELALYCPGGGATAFLEVSQAAGGVESRVCKDKLGRDVRKLQQGFDGRWIANDRRYDAVSRVIQASEPYFLNDEPPIWTTFVYDEIGRLEFVQRADGVQERWAYAQLNRTHTLSSGSQILRTTVFTNNLLGEKVRENRYPDGGESTFEYDALGQLRRVQGPLANASGSTLDDTIEIWYDNLGFKEQVDDPDKGVWRYKHNALGELICQIDSIGNGVFNVYDELGRRIERIDLADLPFNANISDCDSYTNAHTSSKTEWLFETDPASSSFSRLKAEATFNFPSGVSGYSHMIREFSYDHLGRLEVTLTEIREGEGAGGLVSTYEERLVYDHIGRVFQSFDASSDFVSANSNVGGNGQQFVYNAYGHLKELREAGSGDHGSVYKEILSVDARGNITEAIKGNGMRLLAGYDPATGALLAKFESSGSSVLETAVSMSLAWDAYGRLRHFSDFTMVSPGHFEYFNYDGQDRLTEVRYSASGSGSPAGWELRQEMAYDEFGAGNLIWKSDVGDYHYSEAGPHAVSSVDGLDLSYNAAGHMFEDRLDGVVRRSLDYTSFGMVRNVSLNQSNRVTRFHYGPGRSRFLRIDEGAGGVTRTHYVGNVEVVFDPNALCPIEFRRNIGGVAQGQQCDGAPIARTRYLHQDHMGSIVAVSDDFGDVIARMSFDAWGNRRDVVDQANWVSWVEGRPVFVDRMLSITPRGYTGHEHVDGHGLIHMNGRIYDPLLARFLQADPFVEDTGTLNRYTYVHNNPLYYTDPSGYFSVGKWARTAAAVFVSVYTGGSVSGASWGLFGGASVSAGTAVATVTIGGAVSGAIMTGSFEGAAWGAFSAQAFYHFGQALGSQAGARGNLVGGLSAEGLAAKSIGHGLMGGVLSHLQGGRFGHGFLSSGVTGAASPWISQSFNGNVMAQGAFAALVGGSVSSISGGKFANGAVTAAMGYAFNQLPSTQRRSVPDDLRDYISGHRDGKPIIGERTEGTVLVPHRDYDAWIPVHPDYVDKAHFGIRSQVDPNLYDAESLCVSACVARHVVIGEVGARGSQYGLNQGADAIESRSPRIAAGARGVAGKVPFIGNISTAAQLMMYQIEHCAAGCVYGN